MMAFCRKLRRIGGPELLLLLAFSVLARFIGPVIGVPPREGFIPLCSGTEIIYLSLGHGEDGPPAAPADADKRQPGDHVPCPWLGPLLALLPLLVVLALPACRPQLPQPRLEGGFGSARILKPFHSRGPPLLSA